MNKNSDLFDGKVAVVTGASTGIGLGLSRKLLDNGSEVYMSSRTPEHIAEAVESLRQYGGRVHAQVLDVRDEKAVAGYMDYVAARGQVDYLLCNAGVGFLRRRHHAPALPEHLRRVEARCLRVARALKYELEDKHIKMSVVCPGAVATNIFFRSLDTHCIPKRPCPRTRSASNRRGARSLDGIRNGDQVIPLNDDARRLYQAIREGRPEYVEEAMRIVKAQALEGMEATAAAPAVGT